MPSIEIVAINQTHPIEINDLTFAVVVDEEMKSHRLPSRFQADFDRLSGILYHLGNPSLKADRDGRIFFAYKLLSHESQKNATFLQFSPEHRTSASTLLSKLIRLSLERRIIFTSDWQFGPAGTKHVAEITLDEFWRLHDSRQICLNTLYPISE